MPTETIRIARSFVLTRVDDNGEVWFEESCSLCDATIEGPDERDVHTRGIEHRKLHRGGLIKTVRY